VLEDVQLGRTIEVARRLVQLLPVDGEDDVGELRERA